MSFCVNFSPSRTCVRDGDKKLGGYCPACFARLSDEAQARVLAAVSGPTSSLPRVRTGHYCPKCGGEVPWQGPTSMLAVLTALAGMAAFGWAIGFAMAGGFR